MMFQATLDSVAFQLSDAKDTTRFAIQQLSQITGLTWRSEAGRAFAGQVEELNGRLKVLAGVLVDAEAYLAVATNEIRALEAQINEQRMAS